MRSGYKIVISSVIFGLLVWFCDAVMDSLFFYDGSFWDLLILDVPKLEIYFRSQVLIFFTTFGVITAWLFSKRQQAEEALQKAHDELENRVEERTAKLSEANEKLSRQIIERKKAENALQESEKELIIEDNGVGFYVRQILFSEPSIRGLGLASMRERTELSTGTFAIKSANGNGTILAASWPL